MSDETESGAIASTKTASAKHTKMGADGPPKDTFQADRKARVTQLHIIILYLLIYMCVYVCVHACLR